MPDIVGGTIKARRASDSSHPFKRAADRALANCLLDALENVHTENVALQWIIKYFHKELPPQYQLDQMLARAKNDPLVGGHVHAQFALLRARILEDANLQQVLKDVVRVIRQKGT